MCTDEEVRTYSTFSHKWDFDKMGFSVFFHLLSFRQQMGFSIKWDFLRTFWGKLLFLRKQMRRRRNEKKVFAEAKTEKFLHEKSKGGLLVELAKFSPTNGIFNKMGLFSENLAIKVKNGIPFVPERTVQRIHQIESI